MVGQHLPPLLRSFTRPVACCWELLIKSLKLWELWHPFADRCQNHPTSAEPTTLRAVASVCTEFKGAMSCYFRVLN